jgi:hypothetical protein
MDGAQVRAGLAFAGASAGAWVINCWLVVALPVRPTGTLFCTTTVSAGESKPMPAPDSSAATTTSPNLAHRLSNAIRDSRIPASRLERVMPARGNRSAAASMLGRARKGKISAGLLVPRPAAAHRLLTYGLPALISLTD